MTAPALFVWHLRLAFRTLSRHRGAYVHATAILGLGIGMSAAMYSLVDAVLLRPLPFPGESSVYVIWKKDPLAGAHVEELAYPELRDLQENIHDFQCVAVMPTSLYGYGKVLQLAGAPPIQLESAPVSHDFFRVLGVSPLIGRDFRSTDEQVGASPVVILSDTVWRSQFRADSRIVGQMIRLNGQGYTVIGVMGRGVEFPRGAGLWVPLGVDRQVIESRGATFLQAIARATPLSSRERISAQVNALFTRLAADHPSVYSQTQQAVVTPLPEYWTGSARLHLWIMLGASLLLLAAASISAGNLILSRTLGRRREIATRVALGASRAQILLQFGAEGMVTGLLASGGGLLIAQLAIRFLVKWAPADIPRLSDAALDAASFCLAAGTAILAALVCSLLPGWFATRIKVEAALREGGERTSGTRHGRRTQSVFISAQAAVTVLLLILAALLVLSYHSMMADDIGFANRGTLSMNLTLRGPGLFSGQAFDADSRRGFYTHLLERLRQGPGVTSAAAVLVRPLEGDIGWDRAYQFEFQTGVDPHRELPKANYEVVTPGYFETVGTRLLEGRDFDSRDGMDAEAVVIISRALAQQIRRAGYVPVGHHMRFGPNAPWLQVIGVAADARYRNITRSGADIFVPSEQAAAPTNYLVIRGNMPATELAELVRRTLAAFDPNQAVAGIATIGELIDRNAARHRFNMVLLLWFGAWAAILAATGIYSVIAESVAARGREIAIKNALGAERIRLVRDMVSPALLLVAGGEAVGLGCAVASGNLAAELFYGVSPREPAILLTMSVALFLVALTSALVPAWTASGEDPKQHLGTG